MQNLSEIRADFALLDEWEDRYRYVIELGRTLKPLPDELRSDTNKVRGCASQVWLVTTRDQDQSGGEPILHFAGDSDALSVRGLVAIALTLFDGKPASEVVATDADALFDRLGLKAHLTAQRSNGLRAMVDRIKSDAQALIPAA